MAEPREFDLQRFVDAQASVIDRIRKELIAGRKRSHWMWFVFPQIAGLGFSATSVRYAIASLDEACAYLSHPVLGPRLRECTALILKHKGASVEVLLGSPDDRKFHSSMTLFSRAAPNERLFRDALQEFFGGQADSATLEQLEQG